MILGHSQASAEPIVAGVTNFPIAAIQDVELLPGTRFNPTGSSPLITEDPISWWPTAWIADWRRFPSQRASYFSVWVSRASPCGAEGTSGSAESEELVRA
jgi:hypothetical protein